MRIIPKKTKVSTEFFSGVSIADILVGAGGVVLIFFVVVSNLPQKLGICGGIAIVFAMLLVRIDDETNYMFLLRIIKHLSYHKSYRKMPDQADIEDDEAEYAEYIDDAESYDEPECMAGDQFVDEGVA